MNVLYIVGVGGIFLSVMRLVYFRKEEVRGRIIKLIYYCKWWIEFNISLCIIVYLIGLFLCEDIEDIIVFFFVIDVFYLIDFEDEMIC